MNTTIEELRDDANYYGAVGKKYLSNSDIRTLLTNPKNFGASVPDNKNFAEGRWFHKSILEPDKLGEEGVVEASTRNTKVYKEALEESGKDVLLLQSEVDNINRLVTAITGNIHFYELIRDEANIYEEPGIAEIEGLLWKGKADIVHPDYVVDLKTTRDITGFRWSARKYNYDSQAYIYRQIFGRPMIFLAVDKDSGMLGMFECGEDFYEYGRQKVVRAVEQWRKFFGPDAEEDVDNWYFKDSL